ncbi:MAG: MBL fold metallo-hydrolase, partial [Chloroflexi bacterium]|nr:MBL fold metallo-hydrolase [Chloroflexota bacterium]
MAWVQISPRIFRWSDTCNVYCVTAGDRGLLIDAGSGAVVDRLEDIGVRQVEWVLHTHHHRDQSWGAGRLKAHGAKVAVPEHERHLFDQVELFWQHKRVYDNYNDRNTFFALAESVAVDADLEDYETFTWRDVELEIIPAKGHTHGSSMLIGQIDGRRVAFTGDLLCAGGVLYQYHALEYGYADQQGALFTLESLQALRRHAPDVALPSHGDLIEDPVGDCARLEDRLMALARLGAGMRFLGRDGGHGLDLLPDPKFIQVSRHLLWGGPHTCSNFYVLLSDSGKACFIDYGHSFFAHMGVAQEREDG